MFLRKGFFFILILLVLQSYSQTGISLKLGASPWHFVDQFDDLSSPISLGYSGGLNVEQILFNSNVGISSGIEYLYAKPGVKYVDLSDQENALAVIYEKGMNDKFINVVHHEVTVPLLFVFYNNGFRTGIGASISRYYFENTSQSPKFNIFNDYGLTANLGARLSKRLIFSIGYYYGLKKVVNLSALVDQNSGGAPLVANMQQLKISLGFSLFNNYSNPKYFITADQD